MSECVRRFLILLQLSSVRSAGTVYLLLAFQGVGRVDAALHGGDTVWGPSRGALDPSLSPWLCR